MKILLFPSKDEGLGIPIIEAQYFGCRVLTTDKEPMRSLVMPGSELMLEGVEGNVGLLSKMLEGSFDHSELGIVSRKRFSYDDLLRCFDVTNYKQSSIN